MRANSRRPRAAVSSRRASRSVRAVCLCAAALAGGIASAEPADECRPGFVWREALPGDHVCVTPETRDATSRENQLAADRRAQGAHGTVTCRSGFVWREAFAGDHACVTPEARARVRAENAGAAAHTGVTRTGPSGPHSCLPGYVWRMASASDFVCVTPDARAAAAAENARASERTGSDACLAGFVWREAAPGDLVCVSPDRRDQAQLDNSLAAARRFDPVCDAYARRSLEQYAAASAYRLSGCYEEGRVWHGSYDNHYDWCRAATPAARAEELRTRDAGLVRCAGTSPRSGACYWTVVLTSRECLNVDGTPQQIAPGGSLTAMGCASTQEGALARAKLIFGSQQCFTEGDEPLPGCCTFDEDTVHGCGCS